MKNSFYQIAAIAGLSAMTVVPAQIAYAQNATATLILVQGFGCGGHSEGYCKAMVQSNNGKSYLVWYDTQLDVPVGSAVILTYDTYYNSWNQLSNPANGKQANVTECLEVQP